MSKHTPGPWIVLKGDEWTCNIATHEGFNSDGDPMYWNVASYNLRRDEAKANARLIAAAPDLLEALQLAFDTAYAGDPDCWIDLARAAIAKATGEV